MNIVKWCHGCRATVSDWIGEDRPIRIDVECFAPGQSISAPPIWAKALIVPREQEQTVREYLDSIVYNCCIGLI